MNQTDRYDEVFRRGKGLLDFMDEVVKASGIDIEHERLREAVIESAKTRRLFDPIIKAETKRILDSWDVATTGETDVTRHWATLNETLNGAVDALIEFERGIKEQS